MSDIFRLAGANLALELMPLLKDLAKIVTSQAFQNGIKDFGRNLQQALQWIVDNKDYIVPALTAMTGAKVGATAGGAVLGRAGAVLGGLGGAVGGGFAGLEITKGGSSNASKDQSRLQPPGTEGEGTDNLPPIKFTPGGSPSGDQRVLDNLERELELVGASNEQRKISNALKAAGVDLDSRQGQQIASLIGEIEKQSRAMETLDATTQTVAGSMTSAFDEFLESGEVNFESMVDSMLKDLARLAFQLAVIKPLVDGVTGGLGGGGAGGGLGGLLAGLFGGFAEGGPVRGRGTATSDSIPAMLSDGEFVVRAAAARKNMALLSAINSGVVRGYAFGGPAAPYYQPPSMPGLGRQPPATGPVSVVIHNNGTPKQGEAKSSDRPGRPLRIELEDMVADGLRRTGSASNLAVQELGGRTPIIED